MREIKFRAWDGIDMLEVTELAIQRRLIFWKFGQGNTIRFDEIELMQYTGLKDENGVEIYFDDLTKINNKIYRVVKLFGAVAFVCPKTGDFWNYACNLATSKFGELVGNVYENHELLKVEE